MPTTTAAKISKLSERLKSLELENIDTSIDNTQYSDYDYYLDRGWEPPRSAQRTSSIKSAIINTAWH